MYQHYRVMAAHFFSWVFHFIAFALIVLSLYEIGISLVDPQKALINSFIHSINTLVIALAMYELGIGVGKEYTALEDKAHIMTHVRRTVSRFVGTVVIALILESLIMIIKYSQLELAGNLYYPVAIIIAASVLLLSLGGFWALTQSKTQ